MTDQPDLFSSEWWNGWRWGITLGIVIGVVGTFVGSAIAVWYFSL